MSVTLPEEFNQYALGRLLDAVYDEDINKVMEIVAFYPLQKETVEEAIFESAQINCHDIANYLLEQFQECSPWYQVEGNIVSAFNDNDYATALSLLEFAVDKNKIENILFYDAFKDEDYEKVSLYLQLGFSPVKAFSLKQMEDFECGKDDSIPAEALHMLNFIRKTYVGEESPSISMKKYDRQLVHANSSNFRVSI